MNSLIFVQAAYYDRRVSLELLNWTLSGCKLLTIDILSTPNARAYAHFRFFLRCFAMRIFFLYGSYLNMPHTYNLKTLATTSKRWRNFRHEPNKRTQLLFAGDMLNALFVRYSFGDDSNTQCVWLHKTLKIFSLFLFSFYKGKKRREKITYTKIKKKHNEAS